MGLTTYKVRTYAAILSRSSEGKTAIRLSEGRCQVICDQRTDDLADYLIPGVVLLLLLVVALLLFSSVSSEKVEENPRYHEKEDKYDPEESLTACTQIYCAHSFSSY